MSVTTPVERGAEWLLLLFFLPAKHTHARVQAWRRLQRIGAVLLKNSGYALPHSPESREDFEWIRREIVASGGEAMVLGARAPDQATTEEIVRAFRAARGRDFQALAAAASQMLKRASAGNARTTRRALTQGLRRLHERFEETVRRDFFVAPEREKVEALLITLDQRTGRTHTMASTNTRADIADYRGKVWLTRPRPGVDRMSSAWLIRRFIDPDATFVFADPAKTPNAIPFDTFEAEFGHHGTHCTFETFCERFRINDPAVRHIGRIVHDLDLKATTYGEPETATIGRLVEGFRQAHHDDEALLRSGTDMFEALYQSLVPVAGTGSSRSGKPSKRESRTRAARRVSKRR
jgi:hypothetical protein